MTASKLISTYENSHALVIGINDYQFVSPLGYAVNDAQAVAKVLETVFQFPTENIHVLLDQQATKSANSQRAQMQRQAEIDLRQIQPYLESDSTPPSNLLAQLIDRYWAISRENFFRLCLAGDTETALILLQMEIDRRKTAGTWTEGED